jgi:hypothetical protein
MLSTASGLEVPTAVDSVESHQSTRLIGNARRRWITISVAGWRPIMYTRCRVSRSMILVDGRGRGCTEDRAPLRWNKVEECQTASYRAISSHPVARKIRSSPARTTHHVTCVRLVRVAVRDLRRDEWMESIRVSSVVGLDAHDARIRTSTNPTLPSGRRWQEPATNCHRHRIRFI